MKTEWTKRATIEFARTLTFIYQNYGSKSVAKVNKQFAKNNLKKAKEFLGSR